MRFDDMEIYKIKKQSSPRYYRTTVFAIIFVCCATFFWIFQQNLVAEIEFGDTVKEITMKDIHGNQLSLPDKKKVNVLFFFNIESTDHLKLLKDLDSRFNVLRKQRLNVRLYCITRGDAKSLGKIHQNLDLKYSIVNDKEDRICLLYEYTCGECIRLIIVDSEGIVRFNTGRIDYYYIDSIVKRYAETFDK